jgi:hypothetical protein
MANETLDKFIELRIMSMIEDHDIIKRSMQQNFAALTQQNLGFSLRCGQKQELQAIEKTARKEPETITQIAPIDINSLKL